MSALTPIAETGAMFADFGPCVVAVADDGRVVFQATLQGGRTGVFSSDGGDVRPHLTSGGEVAAVVSHADIDGSGDTCVYVECASGAGALAQESGGRLQLHGGELATIGPAGPATNRAGDVGFRGRHASGAELIGVMRGGSVAASAVTGGRFTSFQGLPVVDEEGRLVFRADRRGGGEGLYRLDGDTLETLVETGETFVGLGRFPALDGECGVVFVGHTAEGSGVWRIQGGSRDTLLPPQNEFTGVRGALFRGGQLVLLAAAAKAELGVYLGVDPLRDRVLGLGDPFDGSTIVDFAANPVSLNRRGQLGLRIALADRRQLLIRVDPA